MTIESQVNDAFSTVEVAAVVPHIADKIEPGAILYSSWGYYQTNIDYYMVTRTTKSSAWIVPMRHVETPAAFMSGWTSPLEPVSHTHFCECGHSVHRHQLVLNMAGPDYHVCSERECECRSPRPTAIVPEMHRIRRYELSNGPTESLSLTSYSGAYLWDGRALYATHYA